MYGNEDSEEDEERVMKGDLSNVEVQTPVAS
jgi:hypothetical protein